MSSDVKNIYLVGFMGTGKTQVAKSLARRLGRKLADMDELIVEREGMSIAEIFRAKGEAYFRSLEREMVREFCGQEGWVVACGGGTFADPQNIADLKASGTVFCLASSPDMILKRTAGSDARPLLNVEDPKSRVEGLLSQRAPFYAQAHHTIDADRLTVEETAQAVLDILKKP
jgi:shikimate kinase